MTERKRERENVFFLCVSSNLDSEIEEIFADVILVCLCLMRPGDRGLHLS